LFQLLILFSLLLVLEKRKIYFKVESMETSIIFYTLSMQRTEKKKGLKKKEKEAANTKYIKCQHVFEQTCACTCEPATMLPTA
jgi:hypothetical protein